MLINYLIFFFGFQIRSTSNAQHAITRHPSAVSLEQSGLQNKLHTLIHVYNSQLALNRGSLSSATSPEPPAPVLRHNSSAGNILELGHKATSHTIQQSDANNNNIVNSNQTANLPSTTARQSLPHNQMHSIQTMQAMPQVQNVQSNQFVAQPISQNLQQQLPTNVQQLMSSCSMQQQQQQKAMCLNNYIAPNQQSQNFVPGQSQPQQQTSQLTYHIQQNQLQHQLQMQQSASQIQAQIQLTQSQQSQQSNLPINQAQSASKIMQTTTQTPPLSLPLQNITSQAPNQMSNIQLQNEMRKMSLGESIGNKPMASTKLSNPLFATCAISVQQPQDVQATLALSLSQPLSAASGTSLSHVSSSAVVTNKGSASATNFASILAASKLSGLRSTESSPEQPTAQTHTPKLHGSAAIASNFLTVAQSGLKTRRHSDNAINVPKIEIALRYAAHF